MKQIKIKAIKLENFKGGNVEVDFSDNTNIYGNNAMGKTRLFDAFTWLLFGKDSNNRADFGILNWDSDGNVVHRVDAIVFGVLSVNDKEYSLKRVLSEKWTKPHGEENEVFSGNVTSIWVDDVPVQVGEYKKFIENIISETEFKLLTNPMFFNDDKLITPSKRREMLFSLIGDMSNEEIAFGDNALEELVKEIDGKELISFRKMISDKKLKLKKEIDTFDPAIKENRIKIDTTTDFGDIRTQLENYGGNLYLVEQAIIDESKASKESSDKKLAIQEEINKLSLTIKERELAIKFEFDSVKSKNSNDVALFRQQMQSNMSSIKLINDTIESLKKANEAHSENLNLYRKQWTEELQKPVPDLSSFSCVCTLCGQTLPDDQSDAQKQELIASFNKKRADLKTELSNKGMALSETIKNNEALILENEAKLNDLKTDNIKLNKSITEKSESLNTEAQITLEDLINDDIQLTGMQLEKSKLIIELDSIVIPEPKELIERKEELTSKIDALKSELSKEELNKQYQSRISELEKQKKELGSQLSILEKKEFQLEQLDRKKVELTEEKVASIFKHTRFKMFKPLQNGGFEPVCEAMFNGVPYRDLNTAMKINIGLDIINTFSEFHKVNAPIWIDNAESVVDILQTESQMIKLVVIDDSEKELVQQLKLQGNIVLTK